MTLGSAALQCRVRVSKRGTWGLWRSDSSIQGPHVMQTKTAICMARPAGCHTTFRNHRCGWDRSVCCSKGEGLCILLVTLPCITQIDGLVMETRHPWTRVSEHTHLRGSELLWLILRHPLLLKLELDGCKGKRNQRRGLLTFTTRVTSLGIKHNNIYMQAQVVVTEFLRLAITVA